jgi:DNA-binding HxlR family transcriptional regulator
MRFSDFQRSLGLGRKALSARLKKMVADGVMAMTPADVVSERAGREIKVVSGGCVRSGLGRRREGSR